MRKWLVSMRRRKRNACSKAFCSSYSGFLSPGILSVSFFSIREANASSLQPWHLHQLVLPLLLRLHQLCQIQICFVDPFQSFRSLSGKSSSFLLVITLPLPLYSKCRKGKKLWSFLAPLSAAGGRHSWAALAFLRSRWLDGGDSLFWVPSSLSPPPTCVAGTWSISRRSRQDSGEGYLGIYRSSVPGLLQLSVCGAEGSGGQGWHPLSDLLSLNGWVIYGLENGYLPLSPYFEGYGRLRLHLIFFRSQTFVI